LQPLLLLPVLPWVPHCQQDLLRCPVNKPYKKCDTHCQFTETHHHNTFIYYKFFQDTCQSGQYMYWISLAMSENNWPKI
jgi:hypothetical protein